MILNTSGGGPSATINFAVVGGTSAPSSPKENTIWINTSTAISGYAFDVNEPSYLTSGGVWIKIGSSSSFSFNALKKNNLYVFPLSAAQWNGSKWVDVTAKIYQNGAWKNWVTYLYKSGDECTSLTGGWEATGHRRNPGINSKTINTTKNSNGITLQMGGMYWTEDGNKHESGTLFTAKAIDISNLKTLSINVTQFESGSQESDGFYFGVTSAKQDGFSAWKEVFLKTVGTHSVDVSDVSGNVFVYVALDGPSTNTTVTFNEVYLG